MVCERERVTKLCVKDGVWQRWCVKDGVAKDGVWQSCVWKMVCDKDGVWQSGVWQSGVWQSGVWKMVCDKVSKMVCDKVVWKMVCERRCVWKMVCDKVVGQRWCESQPSAASYSRKKNRPRRLGSHYPATNPYPPIWVQLDLGPAFGPLPNEEELALIELGQAPGHIPVRLR